MKRITTNDTDAILPMIRAASGPGRLAALVQCLAVIPVAFRGRQEFADRVAWLRAAPQGHLFDLELRDAEMALVPARNG